MNAVRALGIATISALFCSCTSTESAVAPLGFGPLARAELAEREASHTARPRDSKPSRSAQRTNMPPPLATPTATRSASTGGAASQEPTHTSAPPDGAVAADSNIADWIGSWKGKDMTRFQIPTFPSEPMTDDQARVRVEAAGAQDIRFILIDSSNEQDLCSLSANLVPPNQARIAPGQACFGSEDESFDLAVHVKNGTAKLQSSTLTLDLALDAVVTSDQVRANGNVEYHFEGNR